MLYNLIVQSFEFGETVIEWIEYAAMLIEVVAVAIIVVSIFYSLLRYVHHRLIGDLEHRSAYRALKGRLAGTMLLGLELLVAADIVRTVALEASLESVAILGLLILIRTFLSWALEVEITGHWPWQAGARAQEEGENG
jgi:uncharacterized membrane protein